MVRLAAAAIPSAQSHHAPGCSARGRRAIRRAPPPTPGDEPRGRPRPPGRRRRGAPRSLPPANPHRSPASSDARGAPAASSVPSSSSSDPPAPAVGRRRGRRIRAVRGGGRRRVGAGGGGGSRWRRPSTHPSAWSRRSLRRCRRQMAGSWWSAGGWSWSLADRADRRAGSASSPKAQPSTLPGGGTRLPAPDEL